MESNHHIALSVPGLWARYLTIRLSRDKLIFLADRRRIERPLVSPPKLHVFSRPSMKVCECSVTHLNYGLYFNRGGWIRTIACFRIGIMSLVTSATSRPRINFFVNKYNNFYSICQPFLLALEERIELPTA